MSAEVFRSYQDDDFTFDVGKNKTRVTVPRLLYKDSPRVLEVIAKVMAEDGKSAFEFIEKARAFAGYKESSSKGIAKAIAKIVPAMLMRHNHEVVTELFNALTYDAFTGEIIDNMQVNEAAEILAHLVDQNYAHLKNLWASLEAMKTSQTLSQE